jgi:probable HAF family extracellular repeat protein
MRHSTATRSLVRALFVALVLAASAAVAGAQAQSPAAYTTTIIETFGGAYSEANDVNDEGWVVGWAHDAAGNGRAFLWIDGVLTDLGTLGGDESEATAVNGLGEIVGWAETASGDRHAVLWVEGTVTDLGTLGGSRSEAWDIDETGRIVGGSEGEGTHGFVWEAGVMTALPSPGGCCSYASAINESGAVAGYAWSASEGGNRPIAWLDGEVVELGHLGGEVGEATDIDDAGRIVGWSTTVPGTGMRESAHAFLWESGAMTDLGHSTDESSRGSVASAISDGGVIVGWDICDCGDFAVTWQDDALVDLRVLDAGLSHLGGVNDRGDIAGYGYVGGAERGVLLEPDAG